MNFSVLMSVYAKERPEYLREALQSFADQTLKADEVVLVEDGPLGEGLKAVIEDFREILNIKSVPLPTNEGLAAALNEGLKHCSHELVARMDSDDVSLPHRFEKQVAFMVDNPEISVCSSYIEERNEDMLRVLGIRALPQEHENIFRFAKMRSPVSHPVVVFKKSAVLSVGAYPKIYPEDHALWCLLLVKGYRFANIPEVLLYMRTGDSFMLRRGLLFLKGEIRTYSLMRKTGFIGWFLFFRNCALHACVRLSPGFIKKILYKYARNLS